MPRTKSDVCNTLWDLDFADHNGLSGLPGRSNEFQDSVGKAPEYASTLDCPMLHMLTGIAPPDEAGESCPESFVENLAWARDFGIGAG